MNAQEQYILDQLVKLDTDHLIDVYNDYIEYSEEYTCRKIFVNDEYNIRYLLEGYGALDVLLLASVSDYDAHDEYVTMGFNSNNEEYLTSADNPQSLMRCDAYKEMAAWIVKESYWKVNDNIKPPTIHKTFNIRKAFDLTIDLDVCGDESIEEITRRICKQLPFMDTDKACKWVEVTDLEDTREFRIHEDEI